MSGGFPTSVLDAIASQPGRAARVGVGLALVSYGLNAGGRRRLLAIAGLLPVVAGAADICVLGPLAGRPSGGPAFRARRPGAGAVGSG